MPGKRAAAAAATSANRALGAVKKRKVAAARQPERHLAALHPPTTTTGPESLLPPGGDGAPSSSSSPTPPIIRRGRGRPRKVVTEPETKLQDTPSPGTTKLYPVSVPKLNTIRKPRKKGKRILSDTGLSCVEEDLEGCQTKPYCCSLCGFSTKLISAYKSHMHCSHEDKMDEEMLIDCPNCSFVSDSKNMKKHIQIFHSDARKPHVTNDTSADQVTQMQPKILQGKILTLVQAVYFCRICHYKDVSVYALMKHVFVLHFGILLNTYIGEIEPKLVSKNKTPLVNNAKPLISKYFCKGCKIKTITHEALIYHILDRHKEVEYQVKVKIGHISELRPTLQTAPKPLLNQVTISASPRCRSQTPFCVRSLAPASSKASQLDSAPPHVESPRLALPHIEQPESALLHVESPESASPLVEQPESELLHVEPPESALPYSESPLLSWVKPLESALSCVDALTPLIRSPSPPIIGLPAPLPPSVESPGMSNAELPALSLHSVRPLAPSSPSVVTLVPLAPHVRSSSSPNVTTQILAPPHVESPQPTLAHIKQPESALLHVEPPESALPYAESPQLSWVKPLELAPSCVDPLTPLIGSPSLSIIEPPAPLLPSLESPQMSNAELPALSLHSVRPLTPPSPSVVTLVPLAPHVRSPLSPNVTSQILASPNVQSMSATSTIKLSLPASVQHAVNMVGLTHDIKPVTVGSILNNVNHFPSQSSTTIRANAPEDVSPTSQLLRHLIQRTNRVVNGAPTYTRLTLQFSLPVSSAGMTGETSGMNSTVQVPMTVNQTNTITSVSGQQIKEPFPEVIFASPSVYEQQSEDSVNPPKTQQWKSCSECSELVPLNLFDSHVTMAHNTEQASDKPEKVVASATYLQRVRAQIGKCLLCKRYVHKNGLLSHLLTHGLSCLFCALTFHDLAQLAEHVKSLHLGLKFESVHYIKDGVPTSSQINGGNFNMTITLPENKMGPNDIHLTLIPNKMSTPHAPLLIEICREKKEATIVENTLPEEKPTDLKCSFCSKLILESKYEKHLHKNHQVAPMIHPLLKIPAFKCIHCLGVYTDSITTSTLSIHLLQCRGLNKHNILPKSVIKSKREIADSNKNCMTSDGGSGDLEMPPCKQLEVKVVSDKCQLALKTGQPSSQSLPLPDPSTVLALVPKDFENCSYEERKLFLLDYFHKQPYPSNKEVETLSSLLWLWKADVALMFSKKQHLCLRAIKRRKPLVLLGFNMSEMRNVKHNLNTG